MTKFLSALFVIAVVVAIIAVVVMLFMQRIDDSFLGFILGR